VPLNARPQVNEIGHRSIDIAALGAVARAWRGIDCTVDRGSSRPANCRISLRQLPVDLMSFCAHKTMAPKG